MIIEHITLVTGDVATHRLDIIDRRAVDACRPLLPEGGEIPTMGGFSLRSASPVFAILHHLSPVVCFGVGVGQDATWDALCAIQAPCAPVVARPPKPRTRWIAVAILPAMAALKVQDIVWMADFERCVAAALLLPNTP